MKRFLGEDFLSTSNIKATKKNIILIHAIPSTRNGDLSFQEKLAKSIPKTRSMVGTYGKYFIDFYLLEIRFFEYFIDSTRDRLLE